MSTDHSRRDRGGLFENTQKRKPSQPDMQGECSIGGTPYEMRAWRREDQLTITVALPRGDQNTYPPDVFRGALETPKVGRASARGAKEAPPAWVGEITGDEGTYAISAFEKQGKSGTYLTLSFERLERPTAPVEPELDEPRDAD
ncbi:MAG: hypothetical protein U0234_05765 [Sandaracinus sp.]